MNKKKAQEVHRKQKPLAKRLSAVVLHSKTDLMHSKSPGRPPSPPVEIGIQHGDGETCRNTSAAHQKQSTPKTKFSSNDKSSEFRRVSSPRLKSFPAEELRRFDASPRVELTLPPYQIYGQGDGLINDQGHQAKIQRNQQGQSQIFNVVPLERSPERQQHRPSVPKPLNHQERMPTEHQSEGNFMRKREFSEEMEKQPVGGKNAMLFSQEMEEQNAKNPTMFSENEGHQYSQRNEPPNHVRFAEQPQEIPQKLNQEVFQEIPQGINPGNYYMPQQFLQQFGGLGMTSPQDVMINQSRMYQYGVQPHFHHQQHHQNQVRDFPGQNQQMYSSNLPHSHQNQQICSLNPSHNPQNMTPQQEQHEYPHQRSQDDNHSAKPLQFTPDMIKVQEKLLKTLHQQGLPEDIANREFEGLLAQQRRELEYIKQLEAFHNSTDDDKVTMEPRRRRRITKIEEDGKPEWMMHITPPWISLAAMEGQNARNDVQKTENRENRQISEEKKSRGEQNGGNHQHQQQNVQQMIMSPFVSPSQQQQTMNPQLYQQQVEQNGLQMQYSQQPPRNGYQTPQNSYQIANYHVCNHNPGQLNCQNQPVPQNNHFFQYQNDISEQQACHTQNIENLHPQNERPRVQPCSLLKLKMYKDVIKRQKQNNGLQDIDVYKEAIAALKNPENKKGLEYLTNLEKKQHQVKLNGIQEIGEALRQSWPHKPPDYMTQQATKTPRANGLENTWNSGSPPTPTRLTCDNDPMPIYPKRIDDQGQGQPPRSHPQNYNPALQNMAQPPDNQFQAQVYAQGQGGSSQDQGNALWRSNSLPADMYSQQRQNYEDVPRGCFGGQGDTQGQTIGRHFEEPKVIGGVTYYGRKPEFMRNSRQYF